MKFSESHEWVRLEGEMATVGITRHAREELGEIIYVELPQIGAVIEAGDDVVVVESTKAAVDIYTPVSGKVMAVNEALRENPEKINEEAEGAGWLYQVKISRPEEMKGLMDEKVYKDFIGK